MKLKAFACLLVGLSVSGCALQKDYITMQRRVIILEEELRQSRSLTQGVEKNATSKNVRLDNRIEGIDEEMRVLRGDLDEILHQSKQNSGQTTDMEQALGETRSSVDVLSKKLTRLEAFTGFEPSDANPATQPSKPDVKPTAQSIYREAKKDFDAGDMESAKSGFASVVETFPTSDSADNAQFWIGEIFYREKWYQKAILEYQKVIENYPSGNKVPAAYLKQGLAFETLGETENSHLILGELLRKFPDTAEASIARKKLGQ
jgi:tol-pal system protein YbgF